MIRESDHADASYIPIIGVSANGFADDIKQAYKAGIDHYITKPVDKDTLLNVIADLIQKAKEKEAQSGKPQ